MSVLTIYDINALCFVDYCYKHLSKVEGWVSQRMAGIIYLCKGSLLIRKGENVDERAKLYLCGQTGRSMSYWYVIWVKTGCEKQVEKRLNDHLYHAGISPFIPMLETLFKRNGKVNKELNVMFPGYVFVETNLKDEEFFQCTRQIIKSSKYVIRILSYGDSNEFAVREDERITLMRLSNSSRCIESSTGFAEGDKFYIQSGPMVGMESIIKGIDKKKMQASFELEFMGNLTRFTVGLELIRKI